MPTVPIRRRARHAAPRDLERYLAVGALPGLLLHAGGSVTVRPGQTLSEIAAQAGVSASAIAAANGIEDSDRIVAGTTLVLPGGAPSSGSPAPSGTYTVRAGDTLSGIAARTGTTVAALQRANGLTTTVIRVGQRLVIPGGGGSAAPTAPRPAGRSEVGALLERTARAYGWNPAFVKAVAWQESGWNNTVVSSAGAVGIMQVLPSTGEAVSRMVGRRLDLRNPADNVEAGVAFLDHLYGLTGGDARMTLAGYYQGLASVRANGMYDDTVAYIESVLALRARFS